VNRTSIGTVGLVATRPLVVGHLGNTLAAFAQCRAAGVDGVELDVRRGRDGTLVVHHNPVIDGVGAIAGLGRDALPEGVPLLEDVLWECADLVVNVEVKNLPIDRDYDPTEEIVGLVVATVDACRMRDRVVVSSFSLPTIDAVREANPGLPTATWSSGCTRPA
jgi:glycerophosphoryl diester phosphodiesterase